MLTVLDQISLAGDRKKQNDDACGAVGPFAWVIDGATDLHGAPLSPGPTDAAWFAHAFNAALFAAAPAHAESAALLEAARAETARRWEKAARPIEANWQTPTASIVLLEEQEQGVIAHDLGDSRLFVLDASGAAHAFGGGRESAKDEVAQVRIVTRGRTERPLDRADVIEELRRRREHANIEGGYWVLGLASACLDHLREATFALARPAHLLLATDGFAALADRYDAYDPQTLVRAALEKGLSALAEELRAIENRDGDGLVHPRWKKSDDATALLLRLQ